MHPAREVSVGDIVKYRLSDGDIAMIAAAMPDTSKRNQHMAGMVMPMVVVRVWSVDCVNGQVFIDGYGTHWATSRLRGDADGNWDWSGHSEGE